MHVFVVARRIQICYKIQENVRFKEKSICICGKSNAFSHLGEASGSLSSTSQSTQLVIVTPQMEC